MSAPDHYRLFWRGHEPYDWAMSWLNVAIVLTVAGVILPAGLFDEPFALLGALFQHRAASAWLVFSCACFLVATCLRMQRTSDVSGIEADWP